MARPRVAVVGGGLGGLSSAIRLARAGFDVELFERSRTFGGKLGELRVGAYRFDTGPTVVTLPEVFRDLFRAAGERLAEHLTFLPIDPLCSYLFADGVRLHAFRDVEHFAAEAESRLGEPREHVRRYLAQCARTYDVAAPMFLDRPLPGARELLSPALLRALLQLRGANMLRTMHEVNKSYFRDMRLVQLFDRYATYNGSSPFRTPATLTLIAAVEHVLGAYTVAGGIRRIADALTGLAERCGVTLHPATAVERIAVANHRARAVVAAGVEIPFDFVVANVDAAVVNDLIAPDGPPAKRGDPPARAPADRSRSRRQSLSAVLFLWTIGARVEEVGLNSVFFSRDYRGEFAELFDRAHLPSDPTIYLHVSSKVNAADAPRDAENWYVLVNAPPDDGRDWTGALRTLRETVLARLERDLGRPIRSLIREERIITPRDIERTTGSFRGSLYGPASNSRIAAFRRHPNRMRGVQGLYVCGGSVHPGGGMPLAILSGKIAADLVLNDARARGVE